MDLPPVQVAVSHPKGNRAIARMRRLLPLLATALLAGCTVGPGYERPSAAALKVPGRFPAQPPGVAMATDADLGQWWTGFGDAVLSDLVQRALAGNLDVATAGARLAQARAVLRQARGAQLPSADVSASVTRSVGRESSSFVDPTTGNIIGGGGDTTVYRFGPTIAWEADIFGGLRRSTQAARADAESAEANLHFAQLAAAADLGSAYFDARQAQGQLVIARNNIASQGETVDIVGWRVQAGLVSSLDLEQARQLRAQTAASIGTLESAYANAVNRVAVLTGDTPGAVNTLMAQPAAIPLLTGAVPASLPAELVQRRPDVVAAERTLAAEVARIGVATADLYPALRLSGSYSGSGTSIGDATGTALGNLVAGITAPIFNAGQLRARVTGQRASADAAFATYRSTVLVAIEEVDDAYVAVASAAKREAALAQADEAARNATIYARSQYRAGLIDFQTLLEAERSLLTSQDSRATARGDRARATVQLYRALGGGWQAAPPPPAAGPYSRTSASR